MEDFELKNSIVNELKDVIDYSVVNENYIASYLNKLKGKQSYTVKRYKFHAEFFKDGEYIFCTDDCIYGELNIMYWQGLLEFVKQEITLMKLEMI